MVANTPVSHQFQNSSIQKLIIDIPALKAHRVTDSPVKWVDVTIATNFVPAELESTDPDKLRLYECVSHRQLFLTNLL